MRDAVIDQREAHSRAPAGESHHSGARGTRFRHVVFADAVRLNGRAFDFSPRGIRADQDIGVIDAHWRLNAQDEAFVRWLFHQCGLDARAYRHETLGRRIASCLRTVRADSVAQAKHILHRQPDLLPAALRTLVIGVTSFFRDAHVFELMRETLLPEVLTRRAFPKILSVGCSDGCELYSIAMLLDEVGALSPTDGPSLVGIDCRSDAVDRANAGVYESASVLPLGVSRIARHFIPADDDRARWQICPRLRDGARFRVANALSLDDREQWDIICCRNLAMYLAPAVAVRLWERLERALCPGGFLVLGKAERPVGAAGLIPVAPCVFRRRPAPPPDSSSSPRSLK
jgi:chemotaxis protein methyltransferase CheR